MPSSTPERTRTIPGLETPVPRLGLGTVNVSSARREAAFALLDAFVELGGGLIDTAAVYGVGDSERALGAWLAARPGVRDRVVIVTKGAHPDAGWRSRMTPELIATDLAGSLERLGIDRVDTYLVHRDDESVPVGEILGALDGLVRAGLTRAIGVSNWSVARLDEAVDCTAANGLAPLAASSSYLGLAEPDGFPWAGCVSARDDATLAWHARTGIPLLAWSAQSGGFFADGFDPATTSPGLVRTYHTAANLDRRARAAELGRRIGVSPVQVALAWVLDAPSAPIALAGARDPVALRMAWGALEIGLSSEDRSWLDTGTRP